MNLIDKFSVNTLHTIRRDFLLLITHPVEYLYSFTYPKNKYVKVLPYDPNVNDAGKKLVKTIQEKYPYLCVHFFGSAALQIAGERDIDLLIECTPDKLDTYLPGIISLFGQPLKIKKRKEFIECEWNTNGYAIELLLINPQHSLTRKMKKVFEVLTTNEKYLKKYEAVKIASSGLSVREYNLRKVEFFTSIGL